MFQITGKELCLCLSEVTLSPLEAMSVEGRVPGLQPLSAFHLERAEIHLSPFWGESLSGGGPKIHPV